MQSKIPSPWVARRFDPAEDYTAVCEWWRGHGWPEIPLELLSTHGMIVDGCCAGWLYKTDSRIAWLEWVVGNPKATTTNVHHGLLALFDALKAESKSRGDTAIFSALKHKGLTRFYKLQGFAETDTGMTHMVLRW